MTPAQRLNQMRVQIKAAADREAREIAENRQARFFRELRADYMRKLIMQRNKAELIAPIL